MCQVYRVKHTNNKGVGLYRMGAGREKQCLAEAITAFIRYQLICLSSNQTR